MKVCSFECVKFEHPSMRKMVLARFPYNSDSSVKKVKKDACFRYKHSLEFMIHITAKTTFIFAIFVTIN